MMRFLLAGVLLLIANRCCLAEPFSIQCQGSQKQQIYFVSIDPDSKKVVYEGPASNANEYPGQIKQAQRDGSLLIELAASGGGVELLWDPQGSRLGWIGFPGDVFRPTLIHSCTKTAVRSAVRERAKPETTTPFSAQCNVPSIPTPTYLTIDEATKEVRLQVPHGRTFAGQIANATGAEISFQLTGISGTLTWNKETSRLNLRKDNASGETYDCKIISVRSVLDSYDTPR